MHGIRVLQRADISLILEFQKHDPRISIYHLTLGTTELGIIWKQNNLQILH